MSEQDYLRNAWTMAGWASELPDGGTLARRLLDIPVVIFRDGAGQPKALVNRCPHRFAPLSRGKVKGDTIECGYHGLTFDGMGKCVKNPYGAVPEHGSSIRSFPVVERYKMLWVWFGDVARADPALVPDFSYHDDDRFRTVYGHSKILAHYELVADNLMDLSHTTFIHPAFGGEFWVPEFSMEQMENRVVAKYRILNSPPSVFSEGFFPAGGRPINEYTTMYWDAPACMQLDIRWAFTDKPDDIVAIQPSTHVLAPASKSETWYFWASAGEQAAPITDEEHRAALIQAFEIEDAPMLEACEDSMEGGDFWKLKPLILPYDGAAIRARHILRRKIREEAAMPAPAAAEAAG